MKADLKSNKKTLSARPPLESDILLEARLPEMEAPTLSVPEVQGPERLSTHLLERNQMIRRHLADHWTDEFYSVLKDMGPARLLDAVSATEQRLCDWALAGGSRISDNQRGCLKGVAASIRQFFSERSVVNTRLLEEITKQTQAVFSYRTPAGVDGFYSRFVQKVIGENRAAFVRSVLRGLGWHTKLAAAYNQAVAETQPAVREEGQDV